MTSSVFSTSHGEIAAMDEGAILREAAKTIRNLSRSSTKSIIAIGNELLIAKANLKHGEFTPWVQRECGFTMRSAQNYIRASEFAAYYGETVALLTPAAIYRVSASNTPISVVYQVIAMLNRSLIPAEGEIEAMIMLFRSGNSEGDLSESRNEKETLATQLASDLQSIIGNTMARELVDGPWDLVGKCLRLLLNDAQPDGSLANGDTSGASETAMICHFPSGDRRDAT